MKLRILPQIDELKMLYFEKSMSLQQIADMYGVTRGAVYLQFRYHGIQTRARGYDPVNKEYPDWNNHVTQQILTGSLLDGGKLVVLGSNKPTIQFMETKPLRKKEYVEWKNEYLKFHYFEQEGRKACLTSRWHPEIDVLFEKYYFPNGMKNIKSLLTNLGEIGIFVWYMDSGELDISDENDPRIALNVDNFSTEDHLLARRWFEERIGQLPEAPATRTKGRNFKRLIFSGEGAVSLLDIITKASEELGFPLVVPRK